MKNKALLPTISGIITFVTILVYVGILFINGIIFAVEQQPIIFFISGVTIISIFANMVSYWSLTEQGVLESDDVRKAFSDYDDFVRDNIKDTHDFDKVINSEYNANKREQRKQEIYKHLLSTDLFLKHYHSRINRILPKMKFITITKYYKNKDKVLAKLNSRLEEIEVKKQVREQVLDMRASTKSINYHRVSPQAIFTRNANKQYYADGVNQLGRHRSTFLITRTAFSTATTFFPILFVFSINGFINTSYIVPISLGLFAVLITILQTVIFAKRYTRNDTIEYLNDLFYICKWYVSYKDKNKVVETPH